MLGSEGKSKAPEHKLQLGTSWARGPGPQVQHVVMNSTLVTAQQEGSCQSLTDPSHWHLLLFSDLVEEFHILYHGICWPIDRIMSVPKYCGCPWRVAT